MSLAWARVSSPLGGGVIVCTQRGRRGLHLLVRILVHWRWLRRLGEGRARDGSWLSFQGLPPLAFGVGLDLTSLARLWLENCLLFWELPLRFVQHQIVLLPDALNGMVSIGVVRLLPRITGGLGAMFVS
ncbi:hypothetical protein V6N12_062341 [Hibiscus sabdariffa]|uniref:Uncharacterized protein n=1 Tax=Hibiscus sabdariffa TaxID=183260 RepID=A0ABR2F8J4_9ROSI